MSVLESSGYLARFMFDDCFGGIKGIVVGLESDLTLMSLLRISEIPRVLFYL